MTSALALVEDAPVVEAALPARSIDPQLIATLSRCTTCGTLLLTAECLYCRALAAEAQVARLIERPLFLASNGTVIDLEQYKAAVKAGATGPAPLIPLGFREDMSNAVGTTCTISAKSWYPLRPVLLTVPPECATGVFVDFKVGRVSQFAGNRPVAMSLFNPVNWTTKEAIPLMEWTVADVGETITLVANFSRPDYNPLIAVAEASLGQGLPPTPDVFHAILWCRPVEGADRPGRVPRQGGVPVVTDDALDDVSAHFPVPGGLKWR